MGPSPQPELLNYPLDTLADVYRANVIAPLGVLQALQHTLKSGARVINITSDAAYATEVGSAEMPSAGRAFTPKIITKLIAKGIQIAPLILHTGVASLEADEPPYEEYYRVSAETAQIINNARKNGGRIIAIGTTVVRALETVADKTGQVSQGEGWTSLIISPDHPMRIVDSLLTGMHEPSATHLSMLQALAGLDHLKLTYEAALNKHYLWHEFGDLHLILP